MKRINFLGGKMLRTLAGAAVLSLGMVAAVGTHASAAQVTETEPNNKSTAATAVLVNQEVTGTLSERSDIDWYKFTIDEPGAISISYSYEATNRSWKGWNTYLYSDPEEKKCYISYTLKGGDGSLVSTESLNVPAGTYYLKIKEYDEDVSGYGYEFTVNYTSAVGTNNEQESNDSASKANAIELGKEYTGSLWAQSDVDWYKFTISEPGTIAVKYTHEATGRSWKGWNTYLYADEEEEICYISYTLKGGDEATTSTEAVNVPAGTYYLKVKYYDEEVWGKEYGLSIIFTSAAGTNMEQESNDTTETANVIEVNKDYRGRISLEKDYDWYTFSLDKPADISVVLSHPVIDSSNTYWNVHIYGDDMTDEYMDLYWSGNKEKQTSSTTPRLAEGKYYVRVGKDYWSNEEYTFSVNATTITPDCEWLKRGTKYYWYEGGVRQGTFNDAQGVIGDGTVRGREIYDAASNGWYWLDSIYDGAKAIGKEVWMPYIYQNEAQWDDVTMRQIANESDEGMGDFVYEAMKSHTGKWVRYDNNGAMLKGWVTISGDLAKLYPDQKGNKYYYDTRTGLMAKGWITMKGKTYHFDEITGVLQ